MLLHDLWKENARKVTKSGHESNKMGRFKLSNRSLRLIR